MKRNPICATAFVVLSAILHAQAPFQFDVISIKRNASDTIAFSVRNLTGGQVVLTNVTVRALLYRAYDVTADTPILGLPSWVDSARYDIIAKAASSPSPSEQQQMWRALLVDRLKLRAHEEMRERALFQLVIARADGKLGTGLTPSTLTCKVFTPPPPDIVAFLRQDPRVLAPEPRPAANPRPLAAMTPEVIAERLKTCGLVSSGNSLVSGSMTMAALAQYLTGPAERVVVDRTGLVGAYAVRMVAPPDDPGSLFTVLQEQLGLKLEAVRAPAPALVIDHIERPSEN